MLNFFDHFDHLSKPKNIVAKNEGAASSRIDDWLARSGMDLYGVNEVLSVLDEKKIAVELSLQETATEAVKTLKFLEDQGLYALIENSSDNKPFILVAKDNDSCQKYLSQKEIKKKNNVFK